MSVPQLTDPTPAKDAPGADEPGDWGHDLLLYGNELILRGSDNGTLVAFLGIAMQEIRGLTGFHNHFGSALLLFSVLMCSVVHFAIGNAYVRRARALLRGGAESPGQRAVRGSSVALAWAAALAQFLCLIVGVILVLSPEPPPLLEGLLLSHFR